MSTAAPRADARATFVSYGVRIEIRSSSPRFLDRLIERLPPGSKRMRTRSVARTFTVIESTSATQNRKALDRFEAEVKLSVAELAPARVFVHAGAVGWRGRALLVPAPTLSGKSSLVAALVKAGASYYSDEYAVLDARGRVHPYPRAIALRNRRTGKQRSHSLADLGGRAGRKPLPVGAVIITRFLRNARWQPTPLSAGAGVLALLANTVPARRDPQRVMAALRRAAAAAAILEGPRGEASRTAQLILSEVWLKPAQRRR